MHWSVEKWIFSLVLVLNSILIRGDKGENVRIDLQWALPTRDQFHLPTMIGDNPLNQGAVGPTTSAYIMGTWTKVHPCQKKEHYSEDPFPYGAAAVGCTTSPRLPPLRRRHLRFEYDHKPYGMEHSTSNPNWEEARDLQWFNV
jgi:hypothetical protein